jgi:hypothetical protein
LSTSISSGEEISLVSVNRAMKRAVSSGLSWNFGSRIRWMSAAAYSATSVSSSRSAGEKSLTAPSSDSLFMIWTAPITTFVRSGTVLGFSRLEEFGLPGRDDFADHAGLQRHPG